MYHNGLNATKCYIRAPKIVRYTPSRSRVKASMAAIRCSPLQVGPLEESAESGFECSPRFSWVID